MKLFIDHTLHVAIYDANKSKQSSEAAGEHRQVKCRHERWLRDADLKHDTARVIVKRLRFCWLTFGQSITISHRKGVNTIF